MALSTGASKLEAQRIWGRSSPCAKLVLKLDSGSMLRCDSGNRGYGIMPGYLLLLASYCAIDGPVACIEQNMHGPRLVVYA